MPKIGFHLTKTVKKNHFKATLKCYVIHVEEKNVFEAISRYYMVIHKLSEKYKVLKIMQKRVTL